MTTDPAHPPIAPSPPDHPRDEAGNDAPGWRVESPARARIHASEQHRASDSIGVPGAIAAALVVGGLVLAVRDRRLLLVVGAGAAVLVGQLLRAARRPSGTTRQDDVTTEGVLSDLALAERNDRYAG